MRPTEIRRGRIGFGIDRHRPPQDSVDQARRGRLAELTDEAHRGIGRHRGRHPEVDGLEDAEPERGTDLGIKTIERFLQEGLEPDVKSAPPAENSQNSDSHAG